MKIWVILVVSTGTPFQWDLFQPEVKAAIESCRSTAVIRHFYSSTSGTTADGKRSSEELWEDIDADIDAYGRCYCG